MSTEQDHRYAVILAGGRGTRLWPLSTSEQPKQFQSLGDSRSLIAQTFDRLATCVPKEHIFVSTTKGYAEDVLASLPGLSPDNVIREPQPEGKPAAFLLIATHIHDKDPDAVVLSAASDSFVAPLESFTASSDKAFRFVEAHPNWTTILGTRPTRPDVSLGYVRATGTARGVPGVHVVRDFSEKPTRDKAKSYVLEPDYFWNSSHYCFRASTLIDAYEEAAAHMHTAVTAYFASGEDGHYADLGGPAHELDPFEKYGWPMGVVECDFSWYDIGTWPSAYRALSDSQAAGLVGTGTGRHVDVGSRRGLVVNESQLDVVTAGLDGLVVIVSDSVVLVASVKQLESEPETVAILQHEVDHQHEPDREME